MHLLYGAQTTTWNKMRRGKIENDKIKQYNQCNCEPVTTNRCNLSRTYAQFITVIVVIRALEYSGTKTNTNTMPATIIIINVVVDNNQTVC